MSNNITQILKNMENDPTWVVQLYESLYSSDFVALVQPGTENSIDSMAFLTYPAKDEITELPLFTEEEFILTFPSIQIEAIRIKGVLLWPRLLQIIETGVCEVAVNPGQSHGIRLNNSIILGMISKYSEEG